MDTRPSTSPPGSFAIPVLLINQIALQWSVSINYVASQEGLSLPWPSNATISSLGSYSDRAEANNVKQMVAGSKGSFINISQMSVCVAQQSVEGRQIPFLDLSTARFHISQRITTVQNCREFVSPQAIIAGIFLPCHGCLWRSYWYAVKTAETGYIQQWLRLWRMSFVCYDRTVQKLLFSGSWFH